MMNHSTLVGVLPVASKQKGIRMRLNSLLSLSVMMMAMVLLMSGNSFAQDQWVVYEPTAGHKGVGAGKHIVLISGDDEYRSEEALPQLGKILTTHHGFKCTVLFPIDPKTGEIKPDHQTNIPGTEALKTADLMIVALRFRNLPDEQMKPIDDYLMSGKPVIGLRTATHSFNGLKGIYAKYNWGYNDPEKVWTQGFGKLVLGETWVAHHGGHKTEASRGIIVESEKSHPINRGLKDGDVWGPADTYTVRLPLPGDSKPLVLGQVTKRKGPQIKDDPFFGLRPDDEAVEGDKRNNPMMPIAWTKSYQLPDGKKGMAFTTTQGAATDLVAEGTRRLVINAVYHLLSIEVPEGGTKVDVVGEFKPTAYGFGNYLKGTKPSLYEMK